MAALTQDKNTRIKAPGRKIALDMEETTEIFFGAGVCVNAAGYAVPASDTAGLTTMGVAQEYKNNAGADGAERIVVQKGVFEFEPDGSNPPTIADIGQTVYWSDDQTVAVAAGPTNDIAAGVLDSIDPVTGKMWVYIA